MCCEHNHLIRSSVDGKNWFWKCDYCGEFFDITQKKIVVSMGRKEKGEKNGTTATVRGS